MPVLHLRHRLNLHFLPGSISKTLEHWNKTCKYLISIRKTCSDIFERLEQNTEHWNMFRYTQFHLVQSRPEVCVKSLLSLAFWASWFMYTQFHLVQRGLRLGDWFHKAFL